MGTEVLNQTGCKSVPLLEKGDEAGPQQGLTTNLRDNQGTVSTPGTQVTLETASDCRRVRG